MPIDYVALADHMVGKDELAGLLGLGEVEQKPDSPEARTERLLALADQVLNLDAPHD